MFTIQSSIHNSNISGTLLYALGCSWMASFYAFEYVWAMIGWSLDERLRCFERRCAYFAGLSIHLSICMSIYMSIYIYVYLSISLAVYLSIYLLWKASSYEFLSHTSFRNFGVQNVDKRGETFQDIWTILNERRDPGVRLLPFRVGCADHPIASGAWNPFRPDGVG